MSDWPKETLYYLHGCKESNCDLGNELGLSEEVISNTFRGLAYEVDFKLSINEDGSNKVLSINGVDVSNLGISL